VAGATLLAGCTCGDAPLLRPACDDPLVVGALLDTVNAHPDYVGTLPGPMVGVEAARETAAETFAEPASFRRLCVGQLRLADGSLHEAGWEVFVTDRTVLGPMAGVGLCVVGRDRRGLDCTAYARGFIPGAVGDPGPASAEPGPASAGP
jgi:hypothetical protein